MSDETQPGTVVGYMRVSTDQQDATRQRKALEAYGITKSRYLYADHGVSGAKTSRPEFDRMLADLEPGDLVVVEALDRLGRNSGHVITTVSDLRERGIHVKSLTDGVDSTTDMGEAMMGMLAIFANMERRFIQRRTRSGLAVAREQGRVGGRPRALTGDRAQEVKRMSESGLSPQRIAAVLKVSRATVYRYLATPDASIDDAGTMPEHH